MVVASWQVEEQTSPEESADATGSIPVLRQLPLLCRRCPGSLWLRNWDRLSCVQGTWCLKLRRDQEGQIQRRWAPAEKQYSCYYSRMFKSRAMSEIPNKISNKHMLGVLFMRWKCLSLLAECTSHCTHFVCITVWLFSSLCAVEGSCSLLCAHFPPPLTPSAQTFFFFFNHFLFPSVYMSFSVKSWLSFVSSFILSSLSRHNTKLNH